ncbi:MAG: Nif3-like dinuclear metal center hexameric protein [Chromatiales bacterium]|jgi:dinuclear metal center YbgI/SA1388 family protein
MTELQALEAYCDELLDADRFDDYCPNGLQVEAGGGVQRLVTGVTASLALIRAAAEAGADTLLVHHGYFWKGEDPVVRGVKAARLRELFARGISLLAYHLPLDAHAELGNNRQLAERLGLTGAKALDEGGLLWGCDLETPLDSTGLAERIAKALDRVPLHAGEGPAAIRRLAWCTGAAQGMIERAAALGFDAYVTGEVSEPTVHLAREHGIHFFSAGHHATERYGVRALGSHLAERFGFEHRFIDIPNPV